MKTTGSSQTSKSPVDQRETTVCDRLGGTGEFGHLLNGSRGNTIGSRPSEVDGGGYWPCLPLLWAALNAARSLATSPVECGLAFRSAIAR